jgi:hypothetical protein
MGITCGIKKFAIENLDIHKQATGTTSIQSTGKKSDRNVGNLSATER